MRPLSHVACVDDDSDILHIVQLALETVGGLKTTIFDGARRALDGLEAANPDLILLDVMMPEMDGPTFLKSLTASQALAKSPVIFMTARVEAGEILRYKALGAIGVVAKPFDPMLLAEDVRAIWRAWYEGGDAAETVFFR